jgi:hypothetical protein
MAEPSLPLQCFGINEDCTNTNASSPTGYWLSGQCYPQCGMSGTYDVCLNYTQVGSSTVTVACR